MDSAFSHLLRPDRMFLRRDALAAGFTDRDLTRAVRSGVLIRLRQGAYAMRHHVARLDDRELHVLRARAVVRASRVRIVLSHVSALAVLGAPLWELPLTQVHVIRSPQSCGRRETGITPHSTSLAARDIQVAQRLEVTTPARACIELTTMTGVERSLPVLNWMLHRQLVTREELATRAHQMRQHPGSLATRLAVSLSQDRSESVGESRTFFLCWRAGLPRPEVNVEVHDSRGRQVARVDLAWPGLGVFLEFDGKEKYLRWRRPGESVGDTVLREKKREELICGLTGWRCIRLVWDDLQQPETTAAWIRSVLQGAPVYNNPLCPRRWAPYVA